MVNRPRDRRAGYLWHKETSWDRPRIVRYEGRPKRFPPMHAAAAGRCAVAAAHSLRSASTGSFLAAMRDGMKPATSVSATEMAKSTRPSAGGSTAMPATP